MAGYHARKSPSGSPSWTLCLAKLHREASIPDIADKTAADRGTICHDISARVLQGEGDHIFNAAAGKHALVEQDTGNVIFRMPGKPEPSVYEVDDDIIDSAKRYVEFVRDLAKGGELMIEQKVEIGHITGEGRWMLDGKEVDADTAGATFVPSTGTSDAVILFPEEICICDLKSGREVVNAKYPIDQAVAELTGKPVGSMMPNTQLVMYAEGARNKYWMWMTEIKRVRMIICQPPLNHIDEFVMDIDEFMWWVGWIANRAALTGLPDAPATPGEKQCKYCRAASTCPELAEYALATALDDFDSLDDEILKPTLQRTREVELHQLPRIYALIDMIEDWCGAIRARMYVELSNGTLGPGCGWKLVRGRKGNRYFEDEKKAEAMMREVGIPESQMWKPRQLVGVPVVEEVLGKKSDKFKKFIPLIAQADGKLTVAPESDERPAVEMDSAAADAFDDESDPLGFDVAADVADYFN